MRTPKWIRKAFLAARVHPFGLGPPAPRRWSIGNAARRLRMVRERRPWERRSRQSFRGGETGAGRCRERSPGSLGGETPDFFTWVGRAAHGGHAVRTLSREGDAATVTRRRTDRPQWCQGAGMNGSDLEKNRDLYLLLNKLFRGTLLPPPSTCSAAEPTHPTAAQGHNSPAYECWYAQLDAYSNAATVILAGERRRHSVDSRIAMRRTACPDARLGALLWCRRKASGRAAQARPSG